ncbi:pentatricopeptide repeat-containing protein At5g66520-like [Malania oleifera]|uniref:pentatricopeptide repeat-containing protein At5g66520-like n=1 Tax=Malania oleifera TaxID=397392 RepID=UPI0025ADC293|nr:pentatricopeptide repeat-containing protein At5g66520-like [Malania oleifera]XP_057962666.1 pentatricopeptide repeat-containing protein At5g66520-like [Malania oleifera]XP_057962667.1 pentatricopeptide repeat-containing protein At5g66520-like [Malania oleifera]XP_057962668.1 pentatricopeptide repeat-containing protein At5g66520-like [Malania oleifera]XP_057962669.1 pentatricopeptide repeat-containing protein At5g66520-like [Malania oleifera]
MQEAKRLHACIITSGLQQQEIHLRKLIALYADPRIPSSLSHARLLFDQIQLPSTFIYNTMFRAYAASTDPLQALHLYRQMCRHGTPPDHYTFPFLLKACSSLSHLAQGEEIHSQALKHGFGSDLFVQNSLIFLYGSNNRISVAHQVFDEMGHRDIATWTTLVTCYVDFCSVESARQVFDNMPDRNVVSYSAMIAGYVRKSRFGVALGLFRELVDAKMEPNDSTIMSVLCACANLGALDMGRWIHSSIRQRKGDQFDSLITTALIDMYVKCGSIMNALCVFEGARKKNVGEWTALMSGLAMHGLGRQLIEAFEEMVSSGVKPNAVTFVALLAGCSHSGLVKEGLSYFNRMKLEYGVDPIVEHFGCVVDLLGRAGLIDQAFRFIEEMPVEANAAIWGALFNACRVYKNVEVGEIAARWLMIDEPWNAAIYVSLLGLYREAGRWDQVEKVKEEMKNTVCRKNPGCSLLEVNGFCFEFVAGDRSHPCALEVCKNLSKLIVEFTEN